MMKICAFQPRYPLSADQEDVVYEEIIQELQQCKTDSDLIVLPEYANLPGLNSRHQMERLAEVNGRRLLACAQDAARRCHALIMLNMVFDEGSGFRNTTYAIDQTGAIVHRYHKQHLTRPEIERLGLVYPDQDAGFSDCVTEIRGVRYGFMTCYDVYFQEHIEYLASQNVDVIVFPSYQRSEQMDILEAQVKLCAYRCNCHVIRSSYSMGDNAGTGACTMVAAPGGSILENLKQQVGRLICCVEPKQKHMRSDSYGQRQIPADLFVEKGKTPWAYPVSGLVVKRTERETPYPRICAHRGFNTVAPENSMPAFAAAIALDCDEIEFDLWPSADGIIMVSHDPIVDRVSNGHGKIMDMTLKEIRQLDIGSKLSPAFRGLTYCTFEEVLRRFAKQTIMNIHIKSISQPIKDDDCYSPQIFKSIADLIRKYDCAGYVYIAGDRDVMKAALDFAPELARCCLCGQQDYSIVENAIKYKCQKLQFFKPFFTQNMIDEAHRNGIRCNIFWSDDADETRRFLEMCIDTILSNDFLTVKMALEKSGFSSAASSP
jgi:glycerophosphoryl diester phosphodiesterase/predicted amidohydrolase